MKFVFHLVNARWDPKVLQERFPDHQMVLTQEVDDLAREIRDADVMVTSNRPYMADMCRAVNDNQTKLKWIQFTTSGIDKAFRFGGYPPGVIITNSAGLGAPVLAEHAFHLFMALGRRIRDCETATKNHEWLRDEITPSVIAMTFKTLVIVGMGATGQEAARRAKAFHMKVIGVSRAYQPDELVDEVYPREKAKEALAQADFVLLSMPATAETADFINDDTLSVMKKSAFIVNVARGDLVDEDALVRACREDRIGGAGLDVTKTEPTPADSPLWDEPRIIVTPHIAGTGAGRDNNKRLIEIIGDNIARYIEGKELTRVLDWEKMKPE